MRAAGEKAGRAESDAARLAGEVQQEQEHRAGLASSVRCLETQLVELEVRTRLVIAMLVATLPH